MAVGEVAGKKWWKGKTEGARKWRNVAISLRVARVGYQGESKVRPYRAIACVGVAPKRPGELIGHNTRLASSRCGDATGKSPTRAIKAAMQDLGKHFK